MTPDGRHIVSASQEKVVRVWDGDTGACLSRFFGTSGLVAVAVKYGLILVGDERGHVHCLELCQH